MLTQPALRRRARESALVFDCQGSALIGVLAEPAEDVAPLRLGVVIVVGGPQYRAGSHRQFTLLARSLAAGGWPTLRFDVRGMGDSAGSMANFENIGEDIRAAIDVMLQRLPQLDGVVLWGLCDGASAALLYLHELPDERVRGLCLVNPWARSGATLASVQVKHYYRERLLQREFWTKLLRGGVGLQAVRGAVTQVSQWLGAAQREGPAAATSFLHKMSDAARRFKGSTLLVLSGNDYTAKEFLEYVRQDEGWQASLQQPRLTRVDIDGADHTFSSPAAEQALTDAVRSWLANSASR